MVVQAEQERENEGGRAVQQRSHKQRRSPSPRAHGRGSRPSDLPALSASLTLATIPLVSQQATDFMSLCFFVHWCVEATYLLAIKTLWNMWYIVAYAERLFIGSGDCHARFTHAVAKAFFQNLSKIKKDCSTVARSCASVRLGDSEMQFPNSN